MKIKVYIAGNEYPDDVVAMRYRDEEGSRVTTWLRHSTCNALGLEKGKTYFIEVTTMPDEYI